MISVQTPDFFSRSRGATLLETIFVMFILAGAFASILSILVFIGDGMSYETVCADQHARTTGTLYDAVAEVREAACYSPNFYLELNPANPPRITFDKINSVDANGAIVWGSKITYRLEKADSAASTQFQADHAGIVPGRVIREETTDANSPPSAAVVEENVPYQFVRNGVTNWGFNVTRNGSALAITLSRFGDTRRDTGNGSGGSDAVAAPPVGTNVSSPISTFTQGSIYVSTVSGVYYLKNPQVVIPAE